MFPGALQQLLDKCSVVVDSKMSSHPFFTVDADKKSVDCVIETQLCFFLLCSMH